MKTVQDPAGTYDVIVAGAGLAGVCAATAAARAGARTAVVERQPFAGGISTASMEPSICNYFHNTQHERIVGGCPLELVERMVRLGAVHKNWHKHRGHIIFDVEIGKLAMDEMLEEAGVEILYDTLVTDVMMEKDRLRGLWIANRSGNRTMRAECIVDATGDADVAARAGAPLHVGPGESVVHSFLFRLGNVDLDDLVRYLKDHPSEYVSETDIALTHEEAIRFYEDTGILMFMHHGAEKMEAIQEPIRRGEYAKEWEGFTNMDAFQMHGIRWSKTLIVNTGYFGMHEPDGRAISEYLRRGRKLAHYVGAFLKRHLPGCEHSFVVSTANDLGLRRTRWLDADFTLTQEMYDAAPRYPDAIGRGIVIGHPRLYLSDETFDAPLRCLIPRRVEGLIIGSGRSASCVPAELLRTMPMTMVVGQGAGAAAAVTVRDGSPVRSVDIASVQKELIRQGVRLNKTA